MTCKSSTIFCEDVVNVFWILETAPSNLLPTLPARNIETMPRTIDVDITASELDFTPQRVPELARIHEWNNRVLVESNPHHQDWQAILTSTIARGSNEEMGDRYASASSAGTLPLPRRNSNDLYIEIGYAGSHQARGIGGPEYAPSPSLRLTQPTPKQPATSITQFTQFPGDPEEQREVNPGQPKLPFDLVSLSPRKTVPFATHALPMYTLPRTPLPSRDPPDGGTQAWLHCLGGLLIIFNCWGSNLSFGVFQEYYANYLLWGPPNTSLSQIAWIGSVQLGLVFLLALPVGRFFDLGRFRVIFVGVHA